MSTITVELSDGTSLTAPFTPSEGVTLIGAVDGQYGRYLVVEAYNMMYALSGCCGASGKGSMGGDDDDFGDIVCRACYNEVDWVLGDVLTAQDVLIRVVVRS